MREYHAPVENLERCEVIQLGRRMGGAHFQGVVKMTINIKRTNQKSTFFIRQQLEQLFAAPEAKPTQSVPVKYRHQRKVVRSTTTPEEHKIAAFLADWDML